MRKAPRSWLPRCGMHVVLTGLLAASAGASVFAVDVQLRDGRVLSGKIVDLASVSTLSGKQEGSKQILCCDEGLRRVYVAETSIVTVNEGEQGEAVAELLLRQRVVNNGRAVGELGIVEPAGPFNQFGHRTVRLVGANGRLQVVQAICEVTPRWTSLKT